MTAPLALDRLSPYLMEAPPVSTGRVLLATGFAHYCALQWGYAPPEIHDAFLAPGSTVTSRRIAIATRLLGGIIAGGIVMSLARPLGGGEPVRLRATTWELDDFNGRFLTSMINLSHAFDPDAVLTHWIFVDLEEWNAVMVASVEGGIPVSNRPGVATKAETRAEPITSSIPDIRAGRLIRLPEVTHLTGMSRSTIFRKIAAGRFPQRIQLAGNMSAWREEEVAKWLIAPS